MTELVALETLGTYALLGITPGQNVVALDWRLWDMYRCAWYNGYRAREGMPSQQHG
jgi:hypothetical protein